MQELHTIDVSNKYMVSFDVVSLLTNIPLKECIDLAVSYIMEGNTKLKLSKADLTKLFTIVSAQAHFVFNGKVHDQIDGVAMVYPIAPVLANLVFGHYEQIWLNMYKRLSIHFYSRYVVIHFVFLTISMKLCSSLNFSIHNMIPLGLLWTKNNKVSCSLLNL